MRLLAIDPGGTVGWAIFDDGKLIEYGSIDTNKDVVEFYYWLMTNIHLCNVVICEDYIIDVNPKSGFNHRFNKGETLRRIGAIQYCCYLYKVEFVLQQRSIKVPASGMAFGVPYKTGQKKNQHHYDAVLHGLYYGMTKLKWTRESIKI